MLIENQGVEDSAKNRVKDGVKNLRVGNSRESGYGFSYLRHFGACPKIEIENQSD